MKHKFTIRSLCTALCCLTLLGACFLQAGAAELPDTAERGSLTVTLKPGHSLTIHRAGELSVRNGSPAWCLTRDFAGSRLSLENLEGAKLPESLLSWAELKGLPGETATAGRDGVIRFENLAPGLYLLSQKTPGEGYYPLTPFLVTLPQSSGEGWNYHVDAQPKTQLAPKPATPGTTPGKPGSNKLPQTGQLNWPVPVLAVCGVSLFTLGLNLYRKGRDDG